MAVPLRSYESFVPGKLLRMLSPVEAVIGWLDSLQSSKNLQVFSVYLQQLSLPSIEVKRALKLCFGLIS